MQDECTDIGITSPISARDARAVLEAERQKRAAECREAVQEALKAHGCVMEAVVTIRGATISSQIVISAND